MAKGGRKYRLVIYEYMLDRWWPVTFWVAFFIFLNVGVLWGAEWYFGERGENPLPLISVQDGLVMISVGLISLLFTLFLLVIRKMAYIQLFDDYLHLATPFFQMNIAYKRIQRSLTAQMYSLFPPKSLSAWNRDLIAPVSGASVVVIHLSAYPLSRRIMGLFLSPFFFYDKTPHLVLFIDDWLKFSTELDSRRSLLKDTLRRPKST